MGSTNFEISFQMEVIYFQRNSISTGPIDTQVVLGVANVHVDAVVLKKDIYIVLAVTKVVFISILLFLGGIKTNQDLCRACTKPNHSLLK